MKIKLILIISFLLVGSCLYSQDTTSREEKTFLKPASYDSTKTLEDQFESQNRFQFIGLQLYLPVVIDAFNGPILFAKHNKGTEKGNKNYTVTDVLTEDSISILKHNNVSCFCGFRFKNLDSLKLQDLIIYGIFVLRENGKLDSLNSSPVYWIVTQRKQAPFSCSYFNSFISLPYYEKLKRIYKNQEVIVISDKSKWLCKNVNLFKTFDYDCKDTIFDVFCVLENLRGEQMRLRPSSDKYGRNFMTVKEYDWLDHANRNEKEIMLKAEQYEKEKFLTECSEKFGKQNGELVAASKIAIGMTTEMCKAAWGTPWNISKITTLLGTKETWSYNWKYNLTFENGKLIKIEH